jgi:type IV pilus assembly protein PilW
MKIRRILHVEAGLTLVELMIAMAIGLLLVLLIGTLFVGSKQTYRTQEGLARVQESGRFVMESLGRNMREAGYTKFSAPIAAVAGATLEQKFTASVGSAFSRIPNAIAAADGGAGADSITLTSDSDKDCLNGVAPLGRAVNKFSINASKQLECLGNASATPQALLDDVEDMQILYGAPLAQGDTTKRYVKAGTAGLDMNMVDNVWLCALVRSHDNYVAPDKQTQKYIDCNGATVTAADKRIRRAFSMTLNLRNRNP